MRLQGVGPKTVAMLYKDLRITSLDDLAQAAKAGRIRALKGMGAKKEELILRALEERQRHAGRHQLDRARPRWPRRWSSISGASRLRAEVDAVGSVRRGTDTCGDLDILACGRRSVADRCVRRAIRASSGCSATATPRPASCCAAASRPTCAASRPSNAARRCSTSPGSKAHNIALRDKALERGWKLNEYGLFDPNDQADRRRDRGRHLRGARPGVDPARAPREPRRDRGGARAARCRR